MKFSITKRRGVAFLLASLALLFSSSDIYANLNGRWIQHPAANFRSEKKFSQVDRIIEGERYVIFSVRGDYLNRSGSLVYATSAKIDPIQIFRYDKTLPWAKENIRALAQEFQLSGIVPVALSYSPALGVLAVAYDNQAVDFIYDDGTMISSKVLSTTSNAQTTVNTYSITFDEEKSLAYLAGSYGYVAMKLSDGEIVSGRNFDYPAAWAARVGDYMVVVTGQFSKLSSSMNYFTSTYVFPLGEESAALSDPISEGYNIQAIMPLTDNTFAAMSRSSNSDFKNTLDLFVIGEDGKVNKHNLAPEGTVDDGASWSFRHLFSTDGYVIPSKDGYAIFNNENIYLLKKGVPFDEETGVNVYKDEALTAISKASLSDDNEKNTKAATYDGSRLWLYTYDPNAHKTDINQGFYYKDMGQGNSWDSSSKSEILTFNAPIATFAAYAKWHPELGLLLRGPGGYYIYDGSGYDQFCQYKDGQWKDLSYAANYTAGSPFYDRAASASFIGIDPLNPNLIWGSSTFKGLHRIDISDYAGNYFQIGSTKNSYMESTPGFFGLMTPLKSYDQCAIFSNVDFDNNNTMWVSYLWDYDGADATEGFYNYDALTKVYCPLYYFTAEDRKRFQNVTASSFKEELKAILDKNVIKVPGIHGNKRSRIISMKSSGNENYIAYTVNTYRTQGEFFLYDHKGTLDDPTDDRMATVGELYDEDGNKVSFLTETGIYEDMAKSELWLCTFAGPFIINPSSLLSGDKTVRRVHITKREGMEVDEYPFEHIQINEICDDKFGRKWLGSETGGIYCLSADNTELLGHYTMENSPLPSDVIVSIACDLEKGSVFVLTDRGMVEFQPEDALVSIPEGSHLSIWPSSITADYKGYISISGAENGSDYVVCDSEGNEVISLGQPEDGLLQWDIKASDSKRVSSGRYNIKRVGKDEFHPIVIMY